MRTILLLPVLLLPACSSIIEGTSQEISVNTNPGQAQCGLYRQGMKIAEIGSTPGSALIKKTKHDITVLCQKEGYQQATYLNHSGAAGATVGNIILGGGIGWAIDSASGADNKYDPAVNVTLTPTQPQPSVAPVILRQPDTPPAKPLPSSLPTS